MSTDEQTTTDEFDQILDRFDAAEQEFQEAKEAVGAWKRDRPDDVFMSVEQFRRHFLRGVSATDKQTIHLSGGGTTRVHPWDKSTSFVGAAKRWLTPAPVLEAQIAAVGVKDVAREVASVRVKHLLQHGTDHPAALEKSTPLPEDFPARAELEEMGVTTFEELARSPDAQQVVAKAGAPEGVAS